MLKIFCKFETDKEKLRKQIRSVLSVAVSYEDFAEKLLELGITVKESRGRLSYLTPDRTQPITARKLGDDFDMAAVLAALDQNAQRTVTKAVSQQRSVTVPQQKNLHDGGAYSKCHAAQPNGGH